MCVCACLGPSDVCFENLFSRYTDYKCDCHKTIHNNIFSSVCLIIIMIIYNICTNDNLYKITKR